MEILIKKDWDYILYKSGDADYILSVVCGTVGLYELDIMLNAEEKDLYNSKGESYIDELAREISYSPKKWEERRIKFDAKNETHITSIKGAIEKMKDDFWFWLLP